MLRLDAIIKHPIRNRQRIDEAAGGRRRMIQYVSVGSGFILIDGYRP